MKEQKEKYESPFMGRTFVELESGFCAASADVANPNADNGRINPHEVNTGFTTDFSTSGWDEPSSTN